MSFYWAIAPIPSSQYPYTMAFWPVQLISMGIWISREIVANVQTLLFSYLGMLSIGALGTLLNRWIGVPFNFIALVTGTQTIVPFSMATLMGGFIGKVIESWVGRETIDRYRTVVIAGLSVGLGVVTGIAGSITLIAKSTWIKPF